MHALYAQPDRNAAPVEYNPSAEPAAPDWTSPTTRDVVMYAVLLRAAYGAVGVHRTGYVTVDRLPATWTVGLATSCLDVLGLLDWYADEHGHRVALLTPTGGALLSQWERQIGGGE